MRVQSGSRPSSVRSLTVASSSTPMKSFKFLFHLKRSTRILMGFLT